MKKKLAAGVLSVVLLVGGATAAFAATNPDKLSEIKVLTQQIFGLQKQIVDKEVEAGQLTQQQADAKKKLIDQRQQLSDQAMASGKVFDQGMRGKGMKDKGMRGDAQKFNNGQPMTEAEVNAWSTQAQSRLTAQVEAMKKNSKLSPDQIKKWSDAAQAQLDVQREAMKSGIFVPGGMGKGMRGGNIVPGTPAPASSTSS